MGLLAGAIFSGPLLAADLTTSEAQEQLSRSLTEQGVNYTVMHEGVDSQRIIMNSSSDLQALRKALYSSPAQPAFLRDSTTVTVSGRVPKDKTVDVILESNLATGYSWELKDSSGNILTQDGNSTYESRGLLGGSTKQILRVKATQDGATETHFVYKRPWQDGSTIQSASAGSPNKITIQLDEVPDVIDLSDPNAVTQTPPEDVHKKLYQPSVDSALPTATLPSSFDWRTSGGVTAVRDQGSCGSCWAFATVGALESAYKVKMGTDVNASEQFLVSCNNNSYSCNGGWFAHDYHANTLGKLQTAAGAVTETDMPYTATNGTCKTVGSHPNQIASWSSIAGYTVPSVDQIKNAIYTYGSVPAAVCVGSAFQAYRSGVFSTDESAACGSSTVNHAIVLVGWDDATQSWVLRNSWSAGWGEQGYMRIKYGTSNVGFGANYVVLASSKTNQTISAITFSPTSLTVGGTATTTATASSGLAVTFSSKTPTVCTITGNTVKGVAAGACTVAADQAGNTTYNAAPQVAQNITVGSSKTNQTIGAITFSPTSLTVGGTATATATASSGLAVTFSSKTPTICTVTGNTVKGVAAGACTVAADQAGNTTYNAATQVTQNITVGSSKTNQTISAITFSPTSLTVGGTTTATATASSGLAVTFSSKTPTICTVTGNTVKGVAAGACTVAADQAGNTTYNAATQVTQNITVKKNRTNQTIGAVTFSPTTLTAGGTTTAGATATSKLAVAFSSKTPTICTVNGNAIKGVAAGTCTVAADQAGNDDYNAAPQVTQNITVGSPSSSGYTLTISKAGTGSGTVTSNPAGLNCGSTCSAKFNSGTSVTLYAAVAAGSTFGGWNNKGCTGSPAVCTVVATFNLTTTKSTASAEESESEPSPSIVITPEPTK